MGDLICRKSMMRCLTPGMCSPHSGCQTSILEDCDVRYAGDSGSTAVNPFGPLAGTISAEDYRRCMAERDQLRAEVEALKSHCTDWQAKCLKRGFEYVRESDDHYVLADTPEMAALLGELLGIEVRSKDNDSYGETVSELREQLESANSSFHRAYELEKENEELRKDAERIAWLAVEGCYLHEYLTQVGPRYGLVWPILEESQIDLFEAPRAAIDAAMGKGGRADG